MSLEATIQEHGDHVYITAPVRLHEPNDAEIETFAFAANLTSAAPNPSITWMRGQYVEADNANRNGDQWAADDLAITSLTPMFMPVSVMHDLRVPVGLIADARLLTPNQDQVPRSRIETSLALWGHRFPEVVEEARINAQQGTLMQSMECVSPAYDCSVCGMTFHRLPDMIERRDWCAHLRGDEVSAEGRAAARILRNVVFTGTGLIFGTRGARGAYPEAYLEVEELAARHREAHEETAKAKPKRGKNRMEIEDARYAELVAAEQKASQVPDLEQRLSAAEKAAEDAEAAKVKAEGERDAKTAEANTLAEENRVRKLSAERLSALGEGFKAKLAKTESIKSRVETQAGELSDEQWNERVAELEALLETKRDAEAEGTDPAANGGGNGNGTPAETEGLFTEEQTAQARVGSGEPAASGEEVAPAARSSVIGGLIKRPTAGAKS